MAEITSLTDKDRSFLLDFAIMIGATSDAIESRWFEGEFKFLVHHPG